MPQRPGAPTAAGTNAPSAQAGAKWPIGKAEEKEDPDTTEYQEPVKKDAGPPVGFRITNIGDSPLGVYHVTQGHDGIAVKTRWLLLQPGKSTDAHGLPGQIEFRVE